MTTPTICVHLFLLFLRDKRGIPVGQEKTCGHFKLFLCDPTYLRVAIYYYLGVCVLMVPPQSSDLMMPMAANKN